jgi:hypothetical protein
MPDNWFLNIPKAEKAARQQTEARSRSGSEAGVPVDPRMLQDPAGLLAQDPAALRTFQQGSLLGTMSGLGGLPPGYADTMMLDPYGLNPHGLASLGGLSPEQALRMQLHREAELNFRQIIAARNAAAMGLMDSLQARALPPTAQGLRGLNHPSPEQMLLLQRLENNRRNMESLGGLPSLGRR